MYRSCTYLLVVYFVILVPLAACSIMPGSVLASQPTLDTCIECHGPDGMGQGFAMVPVIAGMPAGHIEQAIYAYVDGARHCVREPRMCETVSALSESQVTEYAQYFAGKVRGSPREEFNEDLAAEGAVLHEKYCSACHLPPDDENVAHAVGIPLHGQRSEYLRYAIEAYFAGERESLLDAMAAQIDKLKPGDLGVLVNYYSSYHSEEQRP